ncbi:unnamed protein product, partial [Brassica oleracea]
VFNYLKGSLEDKDHILFTNLRSLSSLEINKQWEDKSWCRY